jgi:hypothetical protein
MQETDFMHSYRKRMVNSPYKHMLNPHFSYRRKLHVNKAKYRSGS